MLVYHPLSRSMILIEMIYSIVFIPPAFKVDDDDDDDDEVILL